MRNRTLLAGIAALGTALAAEAAPPSLAKVSVVQLPRGLAVREATLADVDLDGRTDLVVSVRRAGRREGRLLRVHLRRAGEAAFVQEPDATLEVPTDVVAFGVADIDAAPGAEVALFTASGVWVWRTKSEDDRRLEKVLDADFLWQIAEPREVFVWQGSFRDLDKDGHTDLLVPEPDGYRVALQRPGAAGEGAEAVARRFPSSRLLRVPEDASGDDAEPLGARRMRAKAERKRIRVAVQLGDAQAPTDLLAVTEAVPAPQVADFDGDGRADVLAQTPHQLHVWRQRADGEFSEAPDVSVALPVAADRKRRLDVSYSAHVGDLDGDARADCVVFGGAPGGEDVRTQVLVYTQRKVPAEAEPPLFGAKGTPGQVLVIAGLAGSPDLADVDGDKRPDLVTGSVRVDALDALAAATKGTLDAELYVYRNLGGRFSAEPVLRLPIELRAERLRSGRESLVAHFVPDVTGDGVRELLLRDDPERVRLLFVRKNGDALTALDQPLFETSLPEDARLVVGEAPGVPAEFLILEDEQVRHVRFR